MLTLSAQQQLRIDVLMRFLEGKVSRRGAEMLLGVSSDTFRRYLRAYEEKQIRFVLHGNCGKTPRNKTPDLLKEHVLSLWKSQYFDFNIVHFWEKLMEDHNIRLGRETLRRWAHEHNLLKRASRRPPKARHRRPRMAQPGLLLQMDGSHHLWFGNKKSVLIIIIDDATSEIYHAEFFDSEDTVSCMQVVQSVVQKHGLFEALYVDRAGIFGGTKRQGFAQFKRACEELGITTLFAQSPQAKGRVERQFRTFQDRLIPELRLKNIQSSKMANWYLGQEYMPKTHDKKFTVEPENTLSAFRPLDDAIDLQEIFCLKENRIINTDHTIQYQNQIFALRVPFKRSIAHQAVEVRQYLNGSLKVFWRGMPMRLELLKNHSRFPEKIR